MDKKKKGYAFSVCGSHRLHFGAAVHAGSVLAAGVYSIKNTEGEGKKHDQSDKEKILTSSRCSLLPS